MHGSLSGAAAIVGVGASRFERRPEVSVLEHAGVALQAALADAGLTRDAIDGLIVHVGSPRGPDYDTLAQTFGLSPHCCMQSWAHGRFATTVLIQAAMMIVTGLATRVLCMMAMKNSDLGRIGEADNPFVHEQFRENGGPHGEQGEIGMASPIAGAAMGFDLYCRRYDLDRELLAAIPLTFRAHAQLTEDAVMRSPLSIDDYRASRPIVTPLRLLDCSPVGDGAVCMVVAGRSQVGELDRPAWITGAQGIRAGRETFIFAPHGLGMEQQSGRRLTRRETLDRAVWKMAGITPDVIDVAGAYDSFSPSPLYALEDFGFCGEGESLDWIQNGRIGLGGDLPLNTAGGQLSHAQMNGWGQLRELVQQLRGEAGRRQVVGAARAMWMGPGGDALILDRG